MTSHFESITPDTESQPMYSLWTVVATTMFQRLKVLKNLAALSTAEASRILADLQPTSFTFKEDASHQRHLGFVAEEVPDSIATPEKTGYSPMAIIAVLTQVVKEQQQELASLREELASLRQQLA